MECSKSENMLSEHTLTYWNQNKNGNTETQTVMEIYIPLQKHVRYIRETAIWENLDQDLKFHKEDVRASNKGIIRILGLVTSIIEVKCKVTLLNQ